MNERIKQLALQAGITVVPEPFDDASHSWNNTMEKFAELIVRDCIKMVETEAAQYAEPVWAFELVNDMYEQWEISP